MFNKRHVIDELSSYLDNQLSDKQKAYVDQHLKECKSCSQELTRLKLVSEKIKTWQVPNLKETFDSSVTNEIVRRELERGRVKMNKKPLAILIPSGVLAGILVLVLAVGGTRYVLRGIQGGRMQLVKTDVDYRLKEGDTKYEPYYLGSKDEIVMDKAYEGKGRVDNDSRSFSYRASGGYGLHEEIPAAGLVRTETRSLTTPPQNTSVIVIQPVIPATAEGEMVIRTGSVRLEVENGTETFRQASQICQELGGYISNSRFYKDKEGRESGNITMRIPKEKFTTALDKLSTLGKLEGTNTDSRDVGQEYANLKAQLDAKMIVYDKMLEALKQRKVEIPEAVRLENQLTPITKEIETLKNRMEQLQNQVSFTTITLNFHEPTISTKVLKESKRVIKERILSTGINAVKFLAAAIPVVIILGFWVVVIVLVIWAIKHLIIKLFRRG
ncbi:MAG: DUF4349 domain-containing protein [Candidatus Omnitrophota bacterium]